MSTYNQECFSSPLDLLIKQLALHSYKKKKKKLQNWKIVFPPSPESKSRPLCFKQKTDYLLKTVTLPYLSASLHPTCTFRTHYSQERYIYICAYLVEYKSGTTTQPLIFQTAFTNKVYIEFYIVYSKPLHQIKNAASEPRKMT